MLGQIATMRVGSIIQGSQSLVRESSELRNGIPSGLRLQGRVWLNGGGFSSIPRDGISMISGSTDAAIGLCFTLWQVWFT